MTIQPRYHFPNGCLRISKHQYFDVRVVGVLYQRKNGGGHASDLKLPVVEFAEERFPPIATPRSDADSDRSHTVLARPRRKAHPHRRSPQLPVRLVKRRRGRFRRRRFRPTYLRALRRRCLQIRKFGCALCFPALVRCLAANHHLAFLRRLIQSIPTLFWRLCPSSCI